MSKSNNKNPIFNTRPELRGRANTKLNRWQKEDLTTKTIEWILEGRSRAEVKEFIYTMSPVKLETQHADRIINYALLRISEITKQEVPTVLAIHVEWYEQIYKYFESIDNASGMNKALRGKEKLLIKTKTSSLTINAKKTTIIERKVEYDMDKLNQQEKNRMTELINKGK